MRTKSQLFMKNVLKTCIILSAFTALISCKETPGETTGRTEISLDSVTIMPRLTNNMTINLEIKKTRKIENNINPQTASSTWDVELKINGSTTNLMENATLVVKRSYVFRTVIYVDPEPW